jgi:U11/U12 small nuclear ribonucleoprotein 35 kDa protein
LQTDIPPKDLSSNKRKTLFISKLPSNITKEELEQRFSKYGKIRSIRMINDIITGETKGYAFLEYKHYADAYFVYKKFIRKGNSKFFQVDFERARNQQNWKPRRLGGGIGGNKNSGQLRFKEKS